MNQIEWREGRYAANSGHVGKLHLFTVAWKSVSTDPNWVMSCMLPGLEGQRWKDDNENVLRELAVQVLADWLQRVFGIRPAD